MSERLLPVDQARRCGCHEPNTTGLCAYPQGECPREKDGRTKPPSAGVCSTCGKHAEKLYGGEGKYLPECGECWTRGWSQELAVGRAISEASTTSTKPWRSPA